MIVDSILNDKGTMIMNYELQANKPTMMVQ